MWKYIVFKGKNQIRKMEKILLRGPSLIRLNPAGSLCNHRCRMCIMTPDDKRLDAGMYLSLIQNAPRSLKRIEVVGGGEPLLFKNIEVIFQAIKEKKLEGSLITNGSFLSPKTSKLLVDSGWEDIRISFHAASRETYLKIHQVDDFDLVINNVRELLRLRGDKKFPWVAFHFVIQKDNFKDLCDVVTLVNDLRIDAISFDTLILWEGSRGLMLNSSENEEAVRLLQKARREIKISHNIDGAIELLQSHMYDEQKLSRQDSLKGKWCPAVQHQLEVLPDGEVIPCCFAPPANSPRSNIEKNSIKKIWRSYHKFRADLKHGRFYPFCYQRCNWPMPSRK